METYLRRTYGQKKSGIKKEYPFWDYRWVEISYFRFTLLIYINNRNNLHWCHPVSKYIESRIFITKILFPYSIFVVGEAFSRGVYWENSIRLHNMYYWMTGLKNCLFCQILVALLSNLGKLVDIQCRLCVGNKHHSSELSICSFWKVKSIRLL